MKHKERPARISANLVIAIGVGAFAAAVVAGTMGQNLVLGTALLVVLVCTGWLARDGLLRCRRERARWQVDRPEP
ncbi:hypothetical protein [Streptomyces nigrescens]|uniref:hypothetical protein n=1 Tax=Streptomyces nigrescens TaxID=1920 RepID=UPI0037007C0F